MKKAFKIISILLVLLLIVLGIAWFLSRKNAEKRGETPTTFTNFFGLSTKKPGDSEGNSTTLSSEFTDPDTGSNPEGAGGLNGGNTDPSSTGSGGGATQSSEFTAGPFTPINNGDSIPGGTSGGTTTGIGGVGSNTNGSTGGGIGGATPNGGLGVGGAIGTPRTGGVTGNGGASATGSLAIDPGMINECSDTDLNITFTPAELARLNILQQRFSTIASYLHTQNDLDVLQASYDSYEVKNRQLKELILYCENTAPRITNPAFSRHVPTPFWHNTSTDSTAYSEGLTTDQIIIDLESWLRLNLW